MSGTEQYPVCLSADGELSSGFAISNSFIETSPLACFQQEYEMNAVTEMPAPIVFTDAATSCSTTCNALGGRIDIRWSASPARNLVSVMFA